MDIDFMWDYYNSKYEDPVGEICADDNIFYKIRHRTYQDIEALEKTIQELPQDGKCQSMEDLEEWLQKLSDKLKKMLNKTLDNLDEKYSYIIEKAYLQGAFDREKMLR